MLHITSVLYLLFGSPNVLSLADVPPKQLISFPDILRQTFQSLVPQFLRHPIKSFGNAAGDAGKGVAVAAEGDRIAERILKAGAFQKGDDGFRHGLLTGLHMVIARPNFIAGTAQVIAEGLLHIRNPIAKHKSTTFHTIHTIMLSVHISHWLMTVLIAVS